MKKKTKVLYVSYDGMTDPLGESQVIPYLTELSKKGFEIHILSAEKYKIFKNRERRIGEILFRAKIAWHPVFYTKNPPVLSTINDIVVLKRKAKRLHRRYNFDIVHCRSYISAFVGESLKNKYGIKFLFDMRGFYADERVDGNLWSLSNPVFKSVYNYFKEKEKLFLSESNYTVSLTYAGKNIIHTFPEMENIPVEVIPCCADLNHFDYKNVDPKKINDYKSKLEISEKDFILSYLGSVGTWYMLDEMLQFFSGLKKQKSNAKFLFITKDNPEMIYNTAQRLGIAHDDIIVEGAERENVPALVSLSDVSIFFIKPVYSKKASSPTKLAELLGMGIPVICNTGVGDIDKFVPENNLGILISDFNEAEHENAVKHIDELQNISKEHLRSVAEKLFSLDVGVEKYYNVYSQLAGL